MGRGRFARFAAALIGLACACTMNAVRAENHGTGSETRAEGFDTTSAAGALGCDAMSVARTGGSEVEEPELSSAEFDLLEVLAGFVGGSSLSARMRASAFGVRDGSPARTDLIAAAGGPSWKVGLRSRGYNGWNAGIRGENAAGFLSLGSPRGPMRLLLGDFIPSFGMGLIVGGTAFAYPFDRSYPFSRASGVVGTASFYGGGLRGVSLAIERAPLSIELIDGSRRFMTARDYAREDAILGGRLGFSSGRCSLGISLAEGLAGGDLGWAAPPLHLGFEAAGRNLQSAGLVCGLSLRNKRSSAGLLAWSAPPSSQGILGMIDGAELDGKRSRSGGVIVLSRMLPRRVALRGAASRRLVTDGRRQKIRDEWRIEIERSGRPIALKLAWSFAQESERKETPWPPCEMENVSAASSIIGAMRLNPLRRAACNLHVRVQLSDDSSGILVSPGFTLEVLKRHCTVSSAFGRHWAFEGNPSFSFPEPAFPGTYPWRTAWGDGRFASFVISIFNKKLKLSCKARLEDEKSPDLSAMGSLDL